MFGFLLVDKPIGYTSHDAVAVTRRQLGTKKVGHAGTLDPIATGLLVMAVGPATKLLQYLELEPKVYVTTFRFGETTDTYDAEGHILETKEVPRDLEPQIATYLPELTGRIMQLPPMYSAVKIDGRRLYKDAHKGIEVERPKREVNVRSFETLEASGCDVKFKISCDSGTYVRSLAHDLGQMIGCGAHVLELRRTHLGPFDVERAKEPKSLDQADILPPHECLTHLDQIEINEGQLEYILNGNPIRLKSAPASELVLLLSESTSNESAHKEPVRLVALGKCTGPMVAPVKVFADK